MNKHFITLEDYYYLAACNEQVMKKIFLVFIAFLIPSCLLLGQDWISVIGKSPYPPNTKVYFTGYNGFEKVDLGSIRSDSQGEIDYFTDYHGYCMMSVEGGKAYPIILEYDPVCIEWSEKVAFTCEPENAFFYTYLPALQRIDSMQKAYFSMPDSLAHKPEMLEKVDSAMTGLYDELINADESHARVFLLCDLMILQTKMVDSTAVMAEWKDDILGFVSTHFEILKNSVYLKRLGIAYVTMNNKVFRTGLSKNQAMEYDVDRWVTELGGMLDVRQMVEFFALHFIRVGEAEVASRLVGKYVDELKCDQWVGGTPRPANMPYTFNVFFGPDFSNVRGLEQFRGMDKILAFVSTECPASVVAVAGLYDFVTANQIRIPVILVPDYELEGELGVLVEEKAPFGLRTGYKYGGPLMQGAGIKQLPAFMILDRQNLVKEVLYDLETLKEIVTN